MAFDVKVFEPWLSRVRPEGGSEELALAALRSSDAHVHGELVIVVDGARLPHLGSCGPRDVCIGTWLRVLTAVRQALGADDGCHRFDEGEQGQPAFNFQRVGDRVDVSVVDSDIGDGPGDLEWGVKSCTIAELNAGVAKFIAELASSLEEAAPGVGRRWVHSLATSR